jgi:hypothetical protein
MIGTFKTTRLTLLILEKYVIWIATPQKRLAMSHDCYPACLHRLCF